MGCVDNTERFDVDMYNEEGDHFVGSTVYTNNELTHYNITCYVNRKTGNCKTTGKIYITKHGNTGLKKTTYDIYMTEEGWNAHFHGNAPMLKYNVGFGEFQQESYLECPTYSVEYIDDEIVIKHNEVEGFELLD
jgi:hypothetical protein